MSELLYRDGRRCMDRDRFEEAEKIFSIGASKGDVKCIYGLFAIHAHQGDMTNVYLHSLSEAFPKLHELSQQGDAEASFILGRCYEMGVGVSESLETAIYFYQLAAQKNLWDAVYNLGCIYLEHGVSHKQIVQNFFLPAANADHACACFALGHYYEKEGIPRQALIWYHRAAEYGNTQMKEKYKEYSHISS